jgi:alpha-tubulin suppressor-like RCC1 family protein
VAAGFGHTLACSDEGVAYSFGTGKRGRLGHGDTAGQHSPRVIEALQGVHISAVAAGYAQSMALSEAGALYSFGDGDVGQLGHGDGDDQLAPRLVAALQGVRVSAVAAGSYHSLALSAAGEVHSFGAGAAGLGHGDTARQLTPRPTAALQGVRVCGVAAGAQQSIVVSTAGRLYSFGYGGGGHLGHGDHEEQLAPRLVEALQDVRVSAVAAGQAHPLALSEGKVYSFGSGQFGKLGHCNTAAQLTPRVIEGLQGVRVRSVAAGCYTSLAVATDGEAYGWGRGVDEFGQLSPVLGLELMADQPVPLKYPGLRLQA